jgi:hypothetical protein
MIKEMSMVLFKQIAILLTIGLFALFIMTPLVNAQASEAEKPAPEAVEERIPAAPDETIEPNPDNVDPKAILAAAVENLGGLEAFQALEDITFDLEHKHYTKGKNLYFVETATGYYKPGQFFEARLDFHSYRKPDDLETVYDYREILGEDGPFKYLEGKPLRGPVAVREAGERLTKTYFQLFGPFYFDQDQDGIKYLGKVGWKYEIDGEEFAFDCHKILIGHTQNRMDVRGSVLALYIDTETNEIRRYVYQPLMKGSKSVQRTRIVDFLERTAVSKLQIPSYYFIQDYWGGKLNATHKMRITAIKSNTGLKDIGFKMTNQKAKRKMKALDGEAGSLDKIRRVD